MPGPTLPFAPMKTYNPNSVDLRDKFFSLYPSLLSLSLSFYEHLLHPSHPFDFYLLIFFKKFSMSLSLIRVHLCPETIYLFSIQFILNKFSLSHFPTSEIFIKISFLESLTTYYLETCKTIPIVSEFDEIFLGH